MAIVGILSFFVGISILIFAVFIYIRRSSFPFVRNASVVSTLCGSDECKLSLVYTGTDGNGMTVNVYTDDRVTRKEMPIRISERDSSKLIIDYPVLYSSLLMAVMFVIGFVLCTTGLTIIITNAGGKNVNTNYAAQQSWFV